jgi:hypothetical protein
VTVGALAVGGALGGCQDGFSTREAGAPAATDPSTSGAPAGSEAPTAAGSDETDPDVRLLGERVADVEAMSALVAATAARHRRLRPQLRPLVALHDAHRAVLDDAGDPSGAARPRRPQVPRSAEAALAEVLRREERHAATLAGSAVEASSGGFARLLASMSASVTQLLVEARA